MIRVCRSINLATSNDWMATRDGSVNPSATRVSMSIWLVSMWLGVPSAWVPSHLK